MLLTSFGGHLLLYRAMHISCFACSYRRCSGAQQHLQSSPLLLDITARPNRGCVGLQEDAEREPCAEAASAAPSDGIMAIYQQFRHLWARSAQPAHSSHRRNRSRSYTLPSQPQPQPQQPQPPPAAPLQHFEALQQPLPILLPLFGLSAAAA